MPITNNCTHTRRVQAYTLLPSISSISLNKKLGYLSVGVIILIIASLILLHSVTFVIVKGTSMNPTLHENDISIMYKKPYQELEENEIIYFKHNDINVIHRIIDTRKIHGKLAYITKGDNNRRKTETVFKEDYKGKSWEILKLSQLKQIKSLLSD